MRPAQPSSNIELLPKRYKGIFIPLNKKRSVLKNDEKPRRGNTGGRRFQQQPPPARKVRSEGCPPAEGRAPRPP
ncbi:hypothetical protein ACFX2J_038639 [Malus domestica]